MQETEIGGQEPRLGEERDSQRWTHKGSHSESVSHSHMSLPRRAVYLQKEGPRSTLEVPLRRREAHRWLYFLQTLPQKAFPTVQQRQAVELWEPGKSS